MDFSLTPLGLMTLSPDAVPLAPFGKLVLRDLAPLPRPQLSSESTHREAAIEWLVRAQEATPDGGVSYGYSLRGGWRPSYIETTGYIAVTFFRLNSEFGRTAFKPRAQRMIEWLCDVQNRDGSFSNPQYSAGSGIVFDTGQDLFGLVKGVEEGGSERVKRAADRAAQWLVEIADPQGRWTRNTHKGIPHVYNTRVAWALLRHHQSQPSKALERVARANLDWALEQQQPGGLYDRCAFEPAKAPFTHTIAYAIRGLWEAGELLDDERYRASAVRASEALVPLVREDGFLAGQIDKGGRPAARYCCLTGNAQLAIVWAKIHKKLDRPEFKGAASRALRYVMAAQDLTTGDSDRRGAIKGSHPTWGRYSPLTYPNWATKFFVDAMIECAGWLS